MILSRGVIPHMHLWVVGLAFMTCWCWTRAAFGEALARLAAGTEPTATCTGDCRGIRTVGIDDIITLVGIALGDSEPSTCPNGITTGEPVTVAMIIAAVNNALHGCATPTATMTPFPTATATPVTPSPETTATPTPIPTRGIRFCDLPGSVQTTAPGVVVVPGGPADAPDLSFVNLPIGFCAHYFAHVGNTRQLRVAPGGELFVASPTAFTTGGGAGGQAAILILADDDHDGLADPPITFLSELPSTQGMLFTNGYFYYQDGTKIMRRPYTGRVASNPSEQVADITIYRSQLHWPKSLDADDDGTIYVGNGGDEGDRCNPGMRPFHGGILKLDGSPGGTPVAKGFRNPISVRCARGHNLCFAIELARDYSTALGGREKLVPIREGDDWGFPCCASKDLPYADLRPVPDCAGVSAEIDSFVIGHTPFDLDFETGKWPAPWTHRAYVPLHGIYGSWEGAGIVAIDSDAMTGQVLPGSNLGGVLSGAMAEFATGWDDGTRSHGRPATVAFTPDGRLFLGNDNTGDIIWIAPLDL